MSHHFSFDNVGNIVRHQAPEISGDRHIVYNAYGKPTQITKGEIASPVAQEKIWYGPDGDRFYKLSQPSGNKTIYLYGGNFEVNIPARGSKVAIQKTYLGDVIHFREVDVSGAASERYAYVHKDHLGSLELMTDEHGNPISAKGFDPFGDYRDATWSSADSSLASSEFTRGFTGHEHLDDVGLIHMNGRVYDPMLGRFMSPDPIVQSPNYSQSYNRYSYVWNNPLGMVDPTGYCGSISLTTPNIYCTAINVATEGNENENRLQREFSQSHEWVGINGITTGRYRLISDGGGGAVGSIMFGSDASPKFAAENVQIDVSFSGIGTNGGTTRMGRSECMGSCHGYDGTPGRPMTEAEESLLYTAAGSIVTVPLSGGLSLLLSSGKAIQIGVQGQQLSRAASAAAQAKAAAGAKRAQAAAEAGRNYVTRQAVRWSPVIGPAAANPNVHQNALDFIDGFFVQGAPAMTPAGVAGSASGWIWDKANE